MTAALAMRAAAWLALGAAAGVPFFALLHLAARLYAAGGGGGRAVALQVARWGALVALLVAAARAGALPLLAATLGLLVARAVVVRRLGRRRP